MRAEREKLNAKITAGSLRLTSGQLELPAEPCHIILFSGGSCTVRCGDTALLVSPGCVLLLGPGAWVVSQAGHALPEMLGCGFPLTALHEMKNATGEDFLRLFAPGSQMALYGSVQWASRLRTLLEMMRSAMGEPEYPGGLYLALTLHYVEQEHRAQSAADARPRNETVEQICAYLAANYQQKLSLTEVAARFYISPLLPEPAVPAGDGAVHRGLYQRPPHRGGPEASGNDRAEHRQRGGADRLCLCGPLPPRLPGDDGSRAAAISEEQKIASLKSLSPWERCHRR